MSFHTRQSVRSPTVLDVEQPLPQTRLSWPKAFTSNRRSAHVLRRAQRPPLCQHSKQVCTADASFQGLADERSEVRVKVVANICSQSGRAYTQSSHAPAATSLRDYSVQERTETSTQGHLVYQGERQPETVRGGVLSPYYV